MSGSRHLPNVLLIVFDTARADAFEPYGAAAGTTPSFSSLASDGFAHPRAYASGSWTVPSHLSLFSGLLPRAAGMHLGINDGEFFRCLIDGLQDRWLPTLLTGAGYRTVGVSANGWINRHSGFDRGFEEFREVHSPRHTRLGATDVRARSRWALDALRARLDDGAALVAQLLDSTLKGSTPFFCFVNLVECHSPYLPPRPFNSAGARTRMAAARDANRYCTIDGFWRTAFGQLEVPGSSLERMRRQYLDSIRQLDSWLGRLLDQLDRASLLDDTQVIVTSDHGENFGEGGLTGHTFSLDDRLLKVPFASRGPVDLRTPEVLNLADIPAVLGEGLGLAAGPWRQRDRAAHISVSEFVAPGRPGDPVAARNAKDLPERAVRMAFRDFQCATDGRLKVLRDDEGDWIVDLAADPLELDPRRLVPAATEWPAGVRELIEALDAADTAAIDEAPASSLGAGGEAGRHEPNADEVEALEGQMRLLGYL